MKNLGSALGSILIAVAIAAVGGAFVGVYYHLKTIELAQEARYQCALSSRFTTRDAGNNEVWYPVAELYSNCLTEKGI